MEKILLVVTLLLSPALFAYTTIEETALDATGIESLDIRTYSGPLSVTRGDSDEIHVEMLIEFNGNWEDDEAKEALADSLVFQLNKSGSQAKLESWIGNYDENDFSIFTWGLIDLFRSNKSRPSISLHVRVPDGLSIRINDFRGEVIIDHLEADISLETGAGLVEIADLDGDLKLKDGSGEIVVDGVTGDVEINDGSGNMDIKNIGGQLTIQDGSGNINVRTVGKQLDITDGSGNIRVIDLKADGDITDGSGEIDVRSVAGNLSLTDGSGSIDVVSVEKDVIVFSRGSGGFNTRDIQGEVLDSNEQRRER